VIIIVYIFLPYKWKEDINMADNKKKVLEMLAQNKISTDEAYRLLSALESEGSTSEGTAKSGTAEKMKSKYLRVCILSGSEREHGGKGDRVNVRVPMTLIRSGMKFTSLLPPEARDKVTGALHEKGIDFDMRNLKPEDMDELLEALSELEVDVAGSDGETVKVFVE
jgi:hypothetical protein